MDNWSTILSSIKDRLKIDMKDKFTELDFFQNPALWFKHEAQSAHFSGRKFTLPRVIPTSFEKRNSYHLNDDRKHDWFFVNHNNVRNWKIGNWKRGPLDPEWQRIIKIKWPLVCISKYQTDFISALSELTDQRGIKKVLWEQCQVLV